MIELDIKGEVKALRLGPQDVVIITIDQMVSQAELMRINQMWQQATGLPNRVLVLVKGMDVKVVKPHE